MQHQRHIICFGQAVAAGCATAFPLQGKTAGRLINGKHQAYNGNTQFGRDLAGGRGIVFCHHQQLGFQIRQVELEFVGGVGRVQGCGGGAGGDTHKGCCHLRPIGQDNSHGVVAADAQLIQLRDGLFELFAQAGIVQGRTAGRGQRDICGSALGQ